MRTQFTIEFQKRPEEPSPVNIDKIYTRKFSKLVCQKVYIVIMADKISIYWTSVSGSKEVS